MYRFSLLLVTLASVFIPTLTYAASSPTPEDESLPDKSTRSVDTSHHPKKLRKIDYYYGRYFTLHFKLGMPLRFSFPNQMRNVNADVFGAQVGFDYAMILPSIEIGWAFSKNLHLSGIFDFEFMSEMIDRKNYPGPLLFSGQLLAMLEYINNDGFAVASGIGVKTLAIVRMQKMGMDEGDITLAPGLAFAMETGYQFRWPSVDGSRPFDIGVRLGFQSSFTFGIILDRERYSQRFWYDDANYLTLKPYAKVLFRWY